MDAGGGDDKRRVLEATDLVRLIGEHVTLRRKGREWACLCPFHDDHNPSMYVVPHKQIYHCFVCGAGGDAISFVMNYHKASFREALQILADRAGITLSPPPRRGGWTAEGGGGGESAAEGGSSQRGTTREGLLAANRAGQDFFRAILNHPDHGRAAREVLAKRGVSAEMIEMFGLGASPDRWDGLALTAAKKGIATGDLLAAGLLKARESGGAYDAMRNRITFPIHDALGRVIAFGGRRINDEDEPKYLNSPETMLFNKSATLYGLPMAAAAVREAGRVIVTEGYMDCIACHQAGVRNVVATLGTALTPLGARVLRRMCDTIVLLFDGDEAGQRAADRAIEVLFAEPVDVRIATMASVPLGEGEAPPKDPDELLKRPEGRARFEAMIGRAEDALEYRFRRLGARTAGLGLAPRSRAIDEELGRLSELGLGRISPVRRHLIVRRVSQLAGVPETVIAQVLARPVRPAQRWADGARGAAEGGEGGVEGESDRSWTLRGEMLACLMADGHLLEELTADERGRLLAADESALGRVASAMAAATREGRAIGVRDLTVRLGDGPATRLATRLSAELTSRTGDEAGRIAATWNAALSRFRARAHAEAAPSDPLERVGHLRRSPDGGGPRPVLPRREGRPA